MKFQEKRPKKFTQIVARKCNEKKYVEMSKFAEKLKKKSTKIIA